MGGEDEAQPVGGMNGDKKIRKKGRLSDPCQLSRVAFAEQDHSPTGLFLEPEYCRMNCSNIG